MIRKLGLGTVQWGTRYGLDNQHGVTAPEAVKAILTLAERFGVRVLDTASAYGMAESILGQNQLGSFKVVTKTPKFASATIRDMHVHEMAQSLHQSLQRLSSKKVYGLLVHHAQDLLVTGSDKLISSMMNLKERGFVEKVGVSIYDSAQIDAVLKIFTPDIVQVPISVFDQRLLLNGQLEIMKEMGIEIHARSVFMQGLLLMPSNRVPSYFDPIRSLLTRWRAEAEDQGMSLVEAALSFVRDIIYVDTVLVGVESVRQFQSCLADFSTVKRFNGSGLACNDPLFVNPALWKLQ
jgi:aryl-alcohol dehydrogenase-like predicted oxidoreductase